METVEHATNGQRIARGAVAGAAAGLAFAVAMEADMAITGHRLDDIRMLGEIGPFPQYWRAKGLAAHAANSLAIGAIYALVEPRLPGSGWLRGLIYATVENSLLWPLTHVIDRRHPAIRRGDMPRFNEPRSIVLEYLRHAAFGIALGIAYERMRSSNRSSTP